MKLYKFFKNYIKKLNCNNSKIRSSCDKYRYIKKKHDINFINNNYFKKSNRFEGVDLSRLNNNITIIIPIYNALEDLDSCIHSLIRNTYINCDLILINDCSTDDKIRPKLDEYKKKYKLNIYHNPKNIGYTKTVNYGLNLTNKDVVILNSDTEVTPRWLTRLTLNAYSDSKIGTVTPISNNAGTFSFPVSGICNKIPMFVSKDNLGEAIAVHSKRNQPEFPTGNGFCMYIKRELLNEIGFFDEKLFPIGYGEENDFCIRANQKGWKNTIDDSTMIFHKRSSSFKEKKIQLTKLSKDIINKKYPNFEKDVSSHSKSKILNTTRKQIKEVFSNKDLISNSNSKGILYVLHDSVGGTPATTNDLASYILENFNVYILTSNRKSIVLKYKTLKKTHEIKTWTLKEEWKMSHFDRPDFQKIYLQILSYVKIDLVHIRHLLFHTFDLPQICQYLNIPVILSLHDFYFCCPTINLLDNNNKFCRGTCTPGDGICKISISCNKGLPSLKHDWINTWRKNVKELFNNIDHFVTTSASAKNIISEIYPSLKTKKFSVIEHGRNLILNKSSDIKLNKNKIKILVPGNLSVHKGAEFISALKEIDKKNILEFTFVGHMPKKFKHLGKNGGTYKRNDFGNIVKKINPTFIGLFSIWPETYCHTLSESLATGIPILGSNLGSIKERLTKSDAGWLIDVESPQKAFNKIVEIISEPSTYFSVKKNVNLNTVRNLASMATDYEVIYKKFLSKKTWGYKEVNIRKVGILIPAGGIASSYIRLLSYFYDSDLKYKIVTELVDIEQLLSKKNYRDYDVIIVQRTAISPKFGSDFVKQCKLFDVNYIYEIDDDLINSSFEDFPYYEKQKPNIKLLLENAYCITVSNEYIKNVFSVFNKNIKVFNNRINTNNWEHIEVKKIQQKNEINILYSGTITHSKDLQIVRESIRELNKSKSCKYTLYIIGVEENKKSTWYTRIKIPSHFTKYPCFVKWLQSLKLNFDIGIAPLQENNLKKEKSNLKYLEYTMLRIPGIFSNIGPYAKSIENGKTGILLDNDMQSWVNAIKGLKENINLRKSIIDASYEDVTKNYLLRDSESDFLEFLNEIPTS